MRVVAELPRPDCKITIFSMNMKFLVKIEKGKLEQTYKLSEMDIYFRYSSNIYCITVTYHSWIVSIV